MGLAATEVRLQLDNRVAALAGNALHASDEETFQAVGQESAAEELRRLPILVAAFADVDLPQVGRKLGLLVAPAGDIGMGRNDLAPRLQRAARRDRRRLDQCAARLPDLTAELLREDLTAELHLHLVDGVRLWR